MLDGWWEIEIAEESGMSAAGLVQFRNGIVSQNSGRTDIAGTYEEQGSSFLGTLEVALSDPASPNERLFERVHLHVQGQVGAHTIWASGVDLTDVRRRVNLHLQRRALIGRHPASVRPSSPEVPAIAEPWRDTVEKISFGVPSATISETSQARSTEPRFAKARLPREILDGAHDRLSPVVRARCRAGRDTPSSMLASTDPRADTSP